MNEKFNKEIKILKKEPNRKLRNEKLNKSNENTLKTLITILDPAEYVTQVF